MINIYRIMFYLAFGLVPLLGFTLFRVDIAFFQIPLSVLLFVIIFMLSVFLIGNTRLSNEKYYNKFLFLLIFLTFLLIINTFPYIYNSNDITWAIKSIIRLIISLIVFITVSSFLPNDEKLIERLISVYILSSSIIITIYLYKYVSLSAPFLAPHWDVSQGFDSNGKNSLGFYLSVTSAIVFWKYVSKNITSLWVIPLVIHLCAVVYVQSRSAWLALILGTFTVIILYKKRLKYSPITTLPYFSRIMLILGFVTVFFLLIIDISTQREIFLRFSLITSILFSGVVASIDGSGITRVLMIEKAMAVFKNNPVMGAGTGLFPFSDVDNKFKYIDGLVSHNDYLTILSEQGMIGFAVLILMIVQLIRVMSLVRNITWKHIALSNAVIVVLFQMFFLDPLYFSFTYIIFGLFYLIFKKELQSRYHH